MTQQKLYYGIIIIKNVIEGLYIMITNFDKKPILWISVLFSIIIFFTGCGTVGNQSSSSSSQDSQTAQVGQPRAEVKKTVVELVPGTPYTSKAYIYESVIEGPTVMVVGGIHGNEPAGSLAASKFMEIPVLRGKLIVIPRANNVALDANERTLPEIEDLNRAYPGKSDGTPAERLTYDIVQLMKKYQVAMVLDLHEGYAFNAVDHKSVGETILPGKDDTSVLLAMDAVEHINKQITEAKKKFSVLANPIVGSTVHYANTVLKVPAFTVETSSDQPLEDRVNFSFEIAKFLVSSQGVIDK